MLDKIINFLKNLSKKEEKTIHVEIVAVEEPKKERTYLDYDWTPVVEFETGGKAYYEKFLKKMTWPKGESGITMGIGADLGYMTKEEFEKFFSKYFTKKQCERLNDVIGLKGESAKNALSKVKDIELSWDNAYKAFIEWTLPKFWKMTSDLWIGLNKLKEPAQIALVSIVFNRGSATKGPSRVEMVNIKPYVMCQNYNAIAKEIRSMKRLWADKGLDGLLKRREDEAKMVEDCA